MYPEDCVQSLLGEGNWWVKNEQRSICRGALLFSFVPHVDQVPYTFEPMGRTSATEHIHADVKVAPLKVNQPLKQIDLPVAAMPLYKGEVWAAYRAKKRPCLVVGNDPVKVDKELVRGMPKSSSAPTLLVAPYFGADRDGTRAGYNEQFIERIRHCEYPHFQWDQLPIAGGPTTSILRLDQLQPIGAHHDSYKISDYRLSEGALEILDDQLQWLVNGGIREDSDLLAYIELVRESFPT